MAIFNNSTIKSSGGGGIFKNYDAEAINSALPSAMVTVTMPSGKTVTTTRAKLDRLNKFLEENSKKANDYLSTADKLGSSFPAQFANLAADQGKATMVGVNTMMRNVTQNSPILSKTGREQVSQWFQDNADRISRERGFEPTPVNNAQGGTDWAHNIVREAKDINKGKYGIAGSIVMSPFSVPTQFMGTADEALRSYLAENIIAKQGITDPQIIKQTRMALTGKEDFDAPTVKRVLGEAAMTAVEALGVTKLTKAFNSLNKTLDVANGVGDTVNVVDKTNNAIKAMKVAQKSLDATAATAKTGKQILKGIASQGLQAGTLGAIGAGGYAASQDMSNQDILKSAAYGGATGFGIGSIASAIGSVITNSIAKKAGAQSEQLGYTIGQVQDAISDVRTKKRIAAALVKQGDLDGAKLVMSGGFSKSQLQEITDVLNKDNRKIVNGPEIMTPAQDISYGSKITVPESVGKVDVPRTVYHGTNAKFDKFSVDKNNFNPGESGVFFTSNKGEASRYGKNIKEATIDPNANIKKIFAKDIDPEIYAEEIVKAKREGFDGIQLKGVKQTRIGQTSKEVGSLAAEVEKQKKVVDGLANKMFSGEISEKAYSNSPELKKLQLLQEQLDPTHTIIFNPDKIVSQPTIGAKTQIDSYVIPGKEKMVGTGKYSFQMATNTDALAKKVQELKSYNLDPARAVEANRKLTDELVNVAMTNNSGFTKLLNKLGKWNPAKLIEGSNTIIKDWSPEFAARLDVQELYKEQYRGEVENLLSGIRKAEGKNYKTALNKAIEEIKAAKTPEARASLTGIAKQIADVQDARRIAMMNNGIDIGFQEGYINRMIKPGMEGEAKEYIKNSIVKKLNDAVNNGDETTLSQYGLSKNASQAEILDVARNESQGNITSLNVMRNKKGQIKSDVEYSRSDILPDRFYEKDPEILLSSWNDSTSKRLAYSQVFGTSDEIADNLLNQIGEAHGDRAKTFALSVLERQRYGSPTNFTSKTMQNIRSYNMLSKMGLSSITNAGQVANKFTVFGLKKTLDAYTTVIPNWNKYMRIANERGISLTEITDDLMEKVYSGGKKNLLKTATGKMLDINGFKLIETSHRLADIKLADDIMAQMEKKGLDSRYTKNWARKLNVNPEELAKQGLTEANKSLITRNLVGEIDFYVDPKDVASWSTRGEFGKTVSQLGKFGLKQGGFVAKQVIREAVTGRDLLPLLRWYVGGQIVGAGVTAAKGAITGKKRETSLAEAYKSVGAFISELSEGDLSGAMEAAKPFAQYQEENLARAGGLGYAYDVYKGLEYSNDPVDIVLGLGGPTGSTIKDMKNSAVALSKGNTEKAIRDGSKILPGQNIWGPNIDRVTGGNTFTFDPKGGDVYTMTDSLPKNDQMIVSRDDADAFGKSVRDGKAGDSAVIEQIARKLYDEKGKEQLLNAKTKQILLDFVDKYGVKNLKEIAINSYKESAKNSKELSTYKKRLSKSLKEIINSFKTSEAAIAYFDSIGDSLDNYPELKEYYDMKEGN